MKRSAAVMGKRLKSVEVKNEKKREKKSGLVRSILLSVAFLLAGVSGTVLAEEIAISDQEQFIRWHSTAFGTAWYQKNTPQSMIEATDGAYVVAGYSSPSENKKLSQHAYVTKFNKDGSIAWDRVYGGGIDGQGTTAPYANYKFIKIIQLANGDYLAIGETDDTLGMSVSGYKNIFAVRLDNNGNTLWQKAYGLKDKETHINSWEASENADGTLSVIGNRWSKWNYTDYGYPIMIELVLDTNGNLVEDYIIGDDVSADSRIDAGSCWMKKTADGGFVASQNYYSDGWSDSILKFDAAGTQQWAVRLLPDQSSTGYQNPYTQASKIVVLSDGYLVAAITTVIKADGSSDSALIVYKIDPAGNVTWTKLYHDLTLTDRVSNVFADQTGDNEVLLSVENGYSTIDFTVLKINTSEGSTSWVKSYGNKTGFERDYGGNAYLKMLENSNGQIVGIGDLYITRFGGDGSVAFAADEFMVQERTGYTVDDVDTTINHGGFMYKMAQTENLVMEKELPLLTGLSSHDIRVIGEGATLETIAITAPAYKLSYQIGESLDLTGLQVVGTYSNGETKVINVTAANITGFNSAAATANQTLTITVDGKTVTYPIQIVASGEPGQGELTGFLGQDSTGSYYLYHKADFSNSYLAYQINPGLSAAKMYQHFLNNQCRIVALKDLTKGYMDYNAAATASLMAQMRGEAFDVNAYFGRSDAKLYQETVTNLGIVDKDGNVAY